MKNSSLNSVFIYYIYRAVGGNAEAPFVHIMGEEVRFDNLMSVCSDSGDNYYKLAWFYFF